MSLINYCLKVWGCTNKTQLQRIQKLQNFAARVAVGNKLPGWPICTLYMLMLHLDCLLGFLKH
ncbi:hypothetical protein SK128_004710 [Halocaridina rubra]|uniref:Uncharacterized protein n=1 Tax=Halocaridina rubra TaxID=373956 RepID=A0AAN8XQZ4_HALRR